MSTVWHMVRKDGRAMRWPLACWLVLLALKHGIGFWLVWGGSVEAGTLQWLEVLVTALGVSEVVMTALLTALLVQADRLVGSRQFWPTRPISWGRLLVAKVLGVATWLFVPPLVVAAPWWMVCGFDAPLVAAAVVEVVFWQLIAVLPAFLVAALTDSLGRFLVCFLVMIWATLLTVFYAQWLWVKAVAVTCEGFPGLGPAHLLVVAAFLVPVACGVTTLQYRRRNLVRSIGWLVGGWAVAVTLATVWIAMWPPAQRAEARPVGEGAVAPAVTLEWTGVVVDQAGSRDAARGTQIQAGFKAQGWPEGTALWCERQAFDWRWASGLEYRKEGYTRTPAGQWEAVRHLLRLPLATGDEETERWLRANPPPRRAVRSPVLPGANITVAVMVPSSLAARVQREPAQLRVRLDMELRRPVTVAQTGLSDRHWSASRGAGMRIASLAKRTWIETDREAGRRSEHWRGVMVTSHASWSTEPAQRLASWLTGREFTWWRWAPYRLVAVHRASGEGSVAAYGTGPSVRISSVALGLENLNCYGPMVVRDGQWVRRHADWFETTVLTAVQWTTVARFSREVTVEAAKVAP